MGRLSKADGLPLIQSLAGLNGNKKTEERENSLSAASFLSWMQFSPVIGLELMPPALPGFQLTDGRLWDFSSSVIMQTNSWNASAFSPSQ